MQETEQPQLTKCAMTAKMQTSCAVVGHLPTSTICDDSEAAEVQ